MQDSSSGIDTIEIVSMTNATLSIPPFDPCTTDPVIVTATKTNQAFPSQIVLNVTDCAGNRTECDPVITELGGGHFGVVTDTYTNIPEYEHYITFLNGIPGFNLVFVSVNGTLFQVSMQDGMIKVVDVESAMLPGDNTMTFTYWSYTPESSCAVLIADSPGPMPTGPGDLGQ